MYSKKYRPKGDPEKLFLLTYFCWRRHSMARFLGSVLPRQNGTNALALASMIIDFNMLKSLFIKI